MKSVYAVGIFKKPKYRLVLASQLDIYPYLFDIGCKYVVYQFLSLCLSDFLDIVIFQKIMEILILDSS